jgi:hypothetical protein
MEVASPCFRYASIRRIMFARTRRSKLMDSFSDICGSFFKFKKIVRVVFVYYAFRCKSGAVKSGDLGGQTSFEMIILP